MDVIDAAARGDLVVLLAVIVTALAGAVTFLFRLIVKELQDRVKRAENLTDKALESFDGLEKATNTPITYQVGSPIRMESKYLFNLWRLLKNMRKFPLATVVSFMALNNPLSYTEILNNNKAKPNPPPMK